MSERQVVPVGLATMPPGPALAAVLAAIDRTRLSADDLHELVAAWGRQLAHDNAHGYYRWITPNGLTNHQGADAVLRLTSKLDNPDHARYTKPVIPPQFNPRWVDDDLSFSWDDEPPIHIPHDIDELSEADPDYEAGYAELIRLANGRRRQEHRQEHRHEHRRDQAA